jgi:hypothetical protein
MHPRIKHRNATDHNRYAVGALDALAASAQVLDLGNPHTFTKVVAVKRGTASAGETLIIEQSHNGDAETPTWVSAPAAALTGLVASPSSGAAMVVAAVPTARWVRLSYTNGSTAQTALVLELTALNG